MSEVLDFCRELLKLPGTSGDEAAVARATAAKMLALGLDAVSVDEWGNVTCQLTGGQPGPTWVLDGHMDVVEVPHPEAWLHAPWGAEVDGGRLWGRGAADTRGSLAAMLNALGRLAKQSQRAAWRGRVVLVASVCEENMTGAALRPVLQRLLSEGEVGCLITGEPMGLSLATAQKGRCTFELHARGRSAHTSRPELGDNAVYKLMEAVQRLRGLPQPVDEELGPGILELTEILSEPYPNITSVPQACHARLVGRILPDESQTGVLARLGAALSGLEGVELDIAEFRQRCYTGRELAARDFLPGWRCPAQHPLKQTLLGALAAAGLPARTFAAPCGTNASAGAELGIPSFIYGPGSLAEAHIVDEWVDVAELEAASRGFEAMLAALLRG